MNILITGGAGFIGSNFARYWSKRHPEDKIIVYDKLTYAGNKENLLELFSSPNFTFIQGDILDDKLFQSTLVENDINTVVHLSLIHIFNFLKLKRDFEPIVANLTSTFLSLFYNFSMSNFWTFKLGKSQQMKKLSKYAILAVLNYLFGNGAMYLFIEYTDLNHNLAKVLITLMIISWNFLLYKKWVFTENAS